MKYLYLAKKRGAKIAVVNPLREPGLERYWVPSNVESAMFGTKITDEFFPVHTGGDVAFVNGVLEASARDRAASTASSSPSTPSGSTRVLERARGRVVRRARSARRARPRADMERFARMYASREVRGARVVDGHHAARARRRERARDREPRARARQRRPTRRGAHADPRPLGRAGRRRRWAATRPRFPAASRSTEETRRALARRSGASPCRPTPGLDRGRDGRGRAARASSTCCGRAAATSSTCCPRPTSPAPRSRARRCASTRTSS